MGKRRFMGEVEGDAISHASRLSSTRIKSHTRGWDLGVEVIGYIDGNGKDHFEISVTGGSNNASRTRLVLSVYDSDKGTVVQNEETYLVLNQLLKEKQYV